MTSLFPFKKYDWKEGRKEGGIQGSILHFHKRGNFGATNLQRVYNSVAIKSWYPILFSLIVKLVFFCVRKIKNKIKILVSTLWMACSYKGWSGQG
jgi:hypothetical protein